MNIHPIFQTILTAHGIISPSIFERMSQRKELAYFEREIERHLNCAHRFNDEIEEALTDGDARLADQLREHKEDHITNARRFIQLTADIRAKLGLERSVWAELVNTENLNSI